MMEEIGYLPRKQLSRHMGINKCQLFNKALPATRNFAERYGKNGKVERKGNKCKQLSSSVQL